MVVVPGAGHFCFWIPAWLLALKLEVCIRFSLTFCTEWALKKELSNSHTLSHHFYPHKHPSVTSCGNYELGCRNPFGIMPAAHHDPLPLSWRILKQLFLQKPSKYVYSLGGVGLSVPARQHFFLPQSVYWRTCKLLWPAAKPLGSGIQEVICYQCQLANIFPCGTNAKQFEANSLFYKSNWFSIFLTNEAQKLPENNSR